ncbi:hypothetical protein HYW99_03210 [Candidatus Woesearchaeota archaeon]|nr:hypothetical protein [Candidatus Woesearchaeota archaeon]
MQEQIQKSFQRRQVAYKISIVDILNGDFIKDEVSAGYTYVKNLNISRVNIIATVVNKTEVIYSYNSMIVDDGTGRIELRSFDSNAIFTKADIGDVVLVIGRIREFNRDRYILPEIIKRLDNINWLNLRKLELKNNDFRSGFTNKKDLDAQNNSISNSEEICLLIKKLDRGEGALIDEVIKNSSDSKTEDIINKLLESGNIFEIIPGKLKVLE